MAHLRETHQGAPALEDLQGHYDKYLLETTESFQEEADKILKADHEERHNHDHKQFAKSNDGIKTKKAKKSTKSTVKNKKIRKK